MNCIDNYYSKRESNFSDLPPKYSSSFQSKPPTGIKINFQSSSYSAKRQEHQSRSSKFNSSSYDQDPSYPLTRSYTYSEASKTRYSNTNYWVEFWQANVKFYYELLQLYKFCFNPPVIFYVLKSSCYNSVARFRVQKFVYY